MNHNLKKIFPFKFVRAWARCPILLHYNFDALYTSIDYGCLKLQFGRAAVFELVFQKFEQNELGVHIKPVLFATMNAKNTHAHTHREREREGEREGERERAREFFHSLA